MAQPEPIVSVIIPVYNREKHLERCVESVIGQSYQNIEIVLVNDGSQDGSGRICDEYALKDPRIKAVHRENSGASAARNSGLDAAGGEYLSFVDSDDFVRGDYIEKLLDACETYACGAAQCSYEEGRGGRFADLRTGGDVRVIDSRRVFRGRKLKIAVWGKLFKSELFSGLRFPQGRIHEDEFVTYRAVYASGKIAILDDRLYYYYQSGDSVMRRTSNRERSDFLDAYRERIEFFGSRGEEELVLLSRKELALRAMLYYVKNRGRRPGADAEMLRVCRENSRGVFLSAAVNPSEKAALAAFLAAPGPASFVVEKFPGMRKLNRR